MENDPAADYLEINRQLWNARTAYHLTSDFYDGDGFSRSGFSLMQPETALLGDIQGKTVLHLQCHFGQDTISLGKLGAKATGLDISDAAIAGAEKLAAEMGSDATFVCGDVYSAPDLLNEQFDIVFTSYGTIGWLPDMQRWANVVAACLKPGGRLVMADFHPALWMFSNDFSKLEYSYFNRGPIIETLQGTYADKDAEIAMTEIGWNHSFGEIFTALLQAGIRITSFDELDHSPYNCFQNMCEVDPGRYMIKGMEGMLPMMYVLEGELVD